MRETVSFVCMVCVCVYVCVCECGFDVFVRMSL